MPLKRKLLLTIISTVAVFCLVFAPMDSGVVLARTEAEIQADIDAQNAKLAETQAKLDAAQAELNNTGGALNNSQGQIANLQNEIANIEATINVNNIQMQLLSESKKLKETELEQRRKRQEKALTTAYLNWRADSKMGGYLLDKERANPLKQDIYQSSVMDDEKLSIEEVEGQVVAIKGQLDKYQTDTKSLEQQNEELKTKKKDLEAQILALQMTFNAQAGTVAGLNSSAGSIKASISQLSAEQKAVAEYEAWLLSQHQSTGGTNIQNGEYYFHGRGRDAAQGHGVGMSQYGAYSAAILGRSADWILRLYYTGIEINQYTLSSEITVKYCQGSPVFAAYQEGCYGYNSAWVYGYYGPEVTERVSFDTYLAGLGEMPASWPLEARKAQMIAARTYAARYTYNGNPDHPICLTTYCQVSYFKQGVNNQQDAVTATKDLVIAYQGQLIEALYSSDNNQGFGTSDAGTRFQNIYGDPNSSWPYLRAVNDNLQIIPLEKAIYGSYCGSTPCADWGWDTNGFKMADIDTMLDYVDTDPYFWSIHGTINAMRASIGQVAAINFEYDGSNRVRRVVITGTTGNNINIGGWWFKSIWNAWVNTTGRYDFIYSQTFVLLQK